MAVYHIPDESFMKFPVSLLQLLSLFVVGVYEIALQPTGAVPHQSGHCPLLVIVGVSLGG